MAQEQPRPEHEAAQHSRLLEELQDPFEGRQRQAWETQHARFAAAREVLSSRHRELFRELEKLHSRSDEEDPLGSRYRSLKRAEAAGLNLDEVRRELEAAYGEFSALLAKQRLLTAHKIWLPSAFDSLRHPPLTSFLPDAIYEPCYPASWDRLQFNSMTGSGQVIENSSKLDGCSKLGAKLVARNHAASDYDLVNVRRQNGYLVPFRTLSDGPLTIRAKLQIGDYLMSTTCSDEPGWSTFLMEIGLKLVAAVFWNAPGSLPADEVMEQWALSGVQPTGADYPWVAKSYPYDAYVSLFTSKSFPAGLDLWVYFGAEHFITGFLNDTSLDVTADLAWTLERLTIKSI